MLNLKSFLGQGRVANLLTFICGSDFIPEARAQNNIVLTALLSK